MASQNQAKESGNVLYVIDYEIDISTDARWRQKPPVVASEIARGEDEAILR